MPAAADAKGGWGQYSEERNSDLFAADGTFEIVLSLSRLFETINSIYKGTIIIRIILTPKVTGDRRSWKWT